MIGEFRDFDQIPIRSWRYRLNGEACRIIRCTAHGCMRDGPRAIQGARTSSTIDSGCQVGKTRLRILIDQHLVCYGRKSQRIAERIGCTVDPHHVAVVNGISIACQDSMRGHAGRVRFHLHPIIPECGLDGCNGARDAIVEQRQYLTHRNRWSVAAVSAGLDGSLSLDFNLIRVVGEIGRHHLPIDVPVTRSRDDRIGETAPRADIDSRYSRIGVSGLNRPRGNGCIICICYWHCRTLQRRPDLQSSRHIEAG